MRFRVRHEIRFRAGTPARNLVAVLRLSPRSHEGQHVTDWWLDPDIDCNLRGRDDEFGNLTHVFSAGGPLSALTIAGAGTVDTFDTAGVVRATAERLPVEVFLRETPLTAPDDAVRDFVNDRTARATSVLGRLHGLMAAVNGEVAIDSGADGRSAIDAFAQKSGDCNSHAHLFTAGARLLGIPCRVVSGYLVWAETGDATRHSWAEAFVEDLGWIGFDATNNLCPRGEHVRCAVGFDATQAAFVRGLSEGAVTQNLSVTVLG